MVCNRCKVAVASALKTAGIEPVRIALGEVELAEAPGSGQLEQLSTLLEQLGFELIDDRRSRIIEKIKNIIVTLVHHSDGEMQLKLSDILAEKLHYGYNYLSNLFSETEGITIERYFIAQKIEKVKELLMYDELSLAQIADRLGYSSAAYLSNQFKKETGLTPGFYKNLKQKNRRNLDDPDILQHKQ